MGVYVCVCMPVHVCVCACVFVCVCLYQQSSMESVITTLDPGMKEVISKYAHQIILNFR